MKQTKEKQKMQLNLLNYFENIYLYHKEEPFKYLDL